MEEEAFLQAIVAAPADDAPRLVYADWLDERGDPDSTAKAAYLRGTAAPAPAAGTPPGRGLDPGWLAVVGRLPRPPRADGAAENDLVVDDSLRFVPSRVEGLPDVTEVAIWPDRLEARSAGRLVVVRFADIARWPRPARVRRLLARAGWRPGGVLVADRDYFHAPPDRFLRFYTDPPLVVYMPADEPHNADAGCFRRAQRVMGAGGFCTFDLG